MHVAVAKVLHAQGLQIICPSKTNCMRVAAKLQSVSVPTATQNQEPAKEGRRRNAGGEGDFEGGNQFPARDPSVPGTGPPGGFVSFCSLDCSPKTSRNFRTLAPSSFVFPCNFFPPCCIHFVAHSRTRVRVPRGPSAARGRVTDTRNPTR